VRTTIEWTNLEEAREIIDLGTLLTDPSAPYIANTTRNLQFNQSHFIASPDAPDGVTTYVATSDGYSWAAMPKAISANVAVHRGRLFRALGHQHLLRRQPGDHARRRGRQGDRQLQGPGLET